MDETIKITVEKKGYTDGAIVYRTSTLDSLMSLEREDLGALLLDMIETVDDRCAITDRMYKELHK